MSFWVADRRVDNHVDPNEHNGRVHEVSAARVEDSRQIFALTV